MSADRFNSVWESLVSILLDGNTEAAFSAELVTAVSTEIGMGFVPISICWQTMNGNLIPGVALGAVFFKGAGSFAWIVAHCIALVSPQILSPRTCTPLPIACPFSKPHPRQEPWWLLPNERLESPSFLE